MEFNEIKTYLQENEGNEEVKSYIEGFITPDRVNAFLESENGKKLLQPRLDTFFTKGLESFKQKTMPSLISEAVAKANPKETPEQAQIRELTERLNKKEAEEQRQALLNRTLLEADKRKLPKDIIEHFLGENDETTIQNLEKLEKIFTEHVNVIADERIKNGYQPPKGGKEDPAKSIQEAFRNSLNG